MRTATPALQALLNSQQFVRANLFTFLLVSGQTYRWTDADVDVVASNVTYSSTGPSISGAKYQLMRGLQVDTLDLRVLVKPTDTLGGVTWQTAARSGALDAAVVRIDKAFLPAWGLRAESINIFSGSLAEVSHGELALVLKVVSDADKLNTMVPRLQFQPGCMRTLYDAGCTVSRAGFQATGTVTSTSSRALFNTSLQKADAFYALGSVLFTSGANAGVRRSVKSFSAAGGQVELSFPLVFALQPGDGFQIYAGCDKSQGANGCAKFGNTVNFKATPFTPKPEALT